MLSGSSTCATCLPFHLKDAQLLAADVHVALHGELGDTPVTVLPSRPEHFERGQTDSFRYAG
jgi:hypothetical protein